MILEENIPKISTYQKLLQSDSFIKMEKFSNDFLAENRQILTPYAEKWVTDPLHQWSRQYEYPFVFSRVQEYLQSHPKKSRVKILDAGSGVTFFPYYLTTNFPQLKIICDDYNPSLAPIFKKINHQTQLSVKFILADIRHLPFAPGSFEIVYSISTLEHLKDWAKTINEFKRVLKPQGWLILTFDVSLKRGGGINAEQAFQLVKKLSLEFQPHKKLVPGKLGQLLRVKNIVTTHYARQLKKNLLPWKWARIGLPLIFYPNLTFFCGSFEKK